MVEFVDALPEAGTRGRKPKNKGAHYEEARELKRHPGRWAIVPIKSTTPIAKGQLVDFRPAGAFEAVTRLVDGERKTFARYVGRKARA